MLGECFGQQYVKYPFLHLSFNSNSIPFIPRMETAPKNQRDSFISIERGI